MQSRSNLVVETDTETRRPGEAEKMNVLRMNATWYYYIVFSRYTHELRAFRLVGGEYESIEVGEDRLLIPLLGLRLGLWQGCFENIARLWLRWFTASGELILTPSEEAIAAQAKAERLAAKLRELNIDPDELE